MNFFRIALLLALAVVGVLAQVSYLTRLGDVLKKIQDATTKVPALKPCVAGMPLDVPSWVAMDTAERKAVLTKMADQTKSTLLELNNDPSFDKQTILTFDQMTVELVDIVVDGTLANALTAAPSPVATTKPPVATTATPEATTTAPTATTAPTDAGASSNSTDAAPVVVDTVDNQQPGSGSVDTAIESPVVTAPEATTAAPGTPKPTSGSAARLSVAPVLSAVAAALFFAMQ